MNRLLSRWLKECEQLAIIDPIVQENFCFEFKTLDPNFAKSLQVLNLAHVPAGN